MTHASPHDRTTAQSSGPSGPPPDAGGGGGRDPGTLHAVEALAALRGADAPLLSAAARALAVLGVHGQDAPAELLARVLGVDVAAARRAAEGLHGLGVLRDGRFAGPDVRQAVLDDPEFDTRPDVHLSASRTLWATGAAATDVAHHLLAAGAAPEPWAVSVLREAAARALSEYQEATARSFLELAHRGRGCHQESAVVDAYLVDLKWWAGPSLASRHLDGLVTAVRDGRLPHRVASVLARRLAWHGRVEDVHDVLRALEGATGEDRNATMERTVTDLWLAHLYPRMFNQGDPGADSPSAVETVAGTHPWVHACADLRALPADADPAAAASAAERILQGLRLDGTALEPMHIALLALRSTDRLDTGAPWFTALAQEAESQPTPLWRAQLCAARAHAALRRGDIPGAERHATWALDHLPPESWGVTVGDPLGTLVLALTEMNRHDAAAEWLRLPLPTALTQTPYGLFYLRARGHHYLATGRQQAALGDFVACGEITRGWGVELPGLLPWRLDAAEAHLALGRPEAARALVDEQLALPGPSTSRARGTALRLKAATAEAHRRTELLRTAASLLETEGDRLELARVLADLGDAYQALDEPALARTVRSRARQLARICGTERLRRRLAAPAVEPAPPRRGRSGADPLATLTDAERRVAGLAAQGYTNREIAHCLCVTPSTVEQHLTRIFRKLRIDRRTDLAALPGGIRGLDPAAGPTARDLSTPSHHPVPDRSLTR
ncbi:LuxR C-terminal-related transcriptional regulator [Kitasatospora sp. NPDC018058]|uniref:helix-turn-helix transcriptional regulator n=1 Tax=Kitasatospora sp. NPDC018058 TaxID=3364025 RepID=UPI0037BE5307